MIVGTAGHIDHGKTSLVRALTGVDTDRLKEEKARGISIELGYAYQQVANGGVLAFIDVPGHERFVHTMLAGATSIDFVLLVIAVDDGVMPQTLEHLQIVRLLGIERGAVALTKIDRAADARIAEVRVAVDALLADSPLCGIPAFPVSSMTGEGVEDLRCFLNAEASASPSRPCQGHFRLAVDRSFTLVGSGTVVTGTVFAGEVKLEDEVMVSPAGLPARVRSIHAQNRAAQSGRAGDRCALNLAGIAKDEVHRGDWIVAPALHAPTSRFDARIRLLETERPLAQWTPVHVHLGATHVVAHVALLDSAELASGASGLAQIVTEKPLGALHGDVLVLRDAAARRTIGGGTVIDPFGPARRRSTGHRLAMLSAMELRDAGTSIERLLALSPMGLDLAAFARARNLSGALPCPSRCVQVKDGGAWLGFAPAAWQQMKEQAIAGLNEFHIRFPDEPGPERQRLRRMLAPELAPVAWDALLDALLAERRIARSGPWLHLPEHRAALTAAEQVLAEKILPLIVDGAFDPPWIRDIARTLQMQEQQVRRLLLRLTKQGTVFQVTRDLFYAVETVSCLARIAAGLEAEQGKVQAADFRDRTGLGRKRAVQILEFFDRVGYTRRVRQEHRLRGKNPFEAGHVPTSG